MVAVTVRDTFSHWETLEEVIVHLTSETDHCLVVNTVPIGGGQIL